MSICGYVHRSAGAHGAQKRGSEPRELELTGSWELSSTNSRNKLGAFAKAIYIIAAPLKPALLESEAGVISRGLQSEF